MSSFLAFVEQYKKGEQISFNSQQFAVKHMKTKQMSTTDDEQQNKTKSSTIQAFPKDTV